MEIIGRPSLPHVNTEFSGRFRRPGSRRRCPDRRAGPLQGIVTAWDVLRYLYDVASPFVLLAEIELGVRALIRAAMTDAEITVCAITSLPSYAPAECPTRLEDMSFNGLRPDRR